jgi:diguanylate cyclase (GGDEF)-like protein/PAS domain S-box-containing protein
MFFVQRTQPSFRALLIGRLLFLTLVSVLALSLFGGHYLARQIQRDAGVHLRDSGLRVRDGIESYLHLHEKAVESAAKSLGTEVGTRVATRASASALETTAKVYPGFLTLLVSNEQGKIVRAIRRDQPSFTPGPQENQWVRDRQYFLEPKSTGKLYVSGVFRGRGLGNDLIVAMSAPIVDENGKFAGVVEGSIDISRIPLTPTEEHRPILVVAHDAERKIVYSTRPSSHPPLQKWHPFNERESKGGESRHDEIFEFQAPEKNVAGARQVPHLALSLPLTSGGWNVVACLPKQAMEQDLREFYWNAAFALLLLWAFTWQAADLMGRSIAKPLESLVRDMQGYEVDEPAAKGGTQKFVALELAKIQGEFLKMGSRLRDSFGQLQRALAERDEKNSQLNELLEDLDQKVQQRTAQLAESEARFALAVRGSNNGIWDWDLRNGQVFYSDRWKEMFGIPAETKCQTIEDWWGRVHPADLSRLKEEVERYIGDGQVEVLETEYRMRNSDGTWRWVLSSGAAVRSAVPGGGTTAIRMAGSTTDITLGKLVDPLTGLPNRLAMVERLEQVLSREREDASRGFALLFLDVDRFKLINDSLGHVKGDRLLFEVSRRVLASVESVEGAEGCVGRLGGDEFVVLLENPPAGGLALGVAARIQELMEAPFDLDGSLLFATVSIGIAYSGDGVRSAEDIIRNSDSAMYQAKIEGRGRYRLFDSSMHERALSRLELETDLRRALEAGEFLLHYQPQVCLRDGRISGFEALVRWQHPRRGLVPPADFIPISEETGLILPLGRWVLENGCRQLAEWDRLHPFCKGLSMSVNLSALQFSDPSLVPLVSAVLEETGLEPARLRLEVTESMVANDPAGAQSILNSLSELGVGLEIDDFGTGYSCLSQLHQLPFDTLKVDRSFVLAMDEKRYPGQDGRKVVESIITLSNNLGISVIAEGIETESNWTQLAMLGCEFGQGYYFSRPVPPGQALQVAELRTREPWPLPLEMGAASDLQSLQHSLNAVVAAAEAARAKLH